MRYRADSAETRAGQWGEAVATRWLEDQGWYVAPMHSTGNGGAPLARQRWKGLILPDLQLIGGGETRWTEVKWKTAPVFYQITREWRHGVDLHNWEDYLELSHQSGVPGWLAIVQVKAGPDEDQLEPTLLLAPFVELEPHGTVGKFSDGLRMMFCTKWFDVHRLHGFQHPPPTLRKSVRPWEQKSKAGKAPRFDDPIPSNVQDQLF